MCASRLTAGVVAIDLYSTHTHEANTCTSWCTDSADIFQVKNKNVQPTRKMNLKRCLIVGIEPRFPGSLITLTSLLALEETDHNFNHSTKPMQKIKGLLGIKGLKLV